MALKDTRKDTRTIAKELDVQCVLEGSVRRAGDDVRITAQLIDAGTDTHLWTETYEGTLKDVFEIQEKVARSIVDELQLELKPEEEQRLTERPIDNPQAYDCYLRARHETEVFTKDGFDRAIEHLQAGLDLVGENAALLAGMGYVYFHYANIGVGKEDYADRAEEYARKALDLNPHSAWAHLVLGCVFQAFRGNPRQAFHHLRSGLKIKPDDPHLLYWFTIGQYPVGKSDESEPLVRRLQEVDPLSPYARWLPAGVDLGLGKFDQASDFAWHQLPQTPHFDFFHTLALTYAGRVDQALSLIHERAQEESDDLFLQMMRVLGRAIGGEPEPLSHLLSGEKSKTIRRDPVWAYFSASFCALAGLEERAMELLSVAVDQGFLNYPLLAEHDPFLSKFRGEPLYEALLERVKHEWEYFEV
jgi:tetratricopeptide (TPR) repeat protein